MQTQLQHFKKMYYPRLIDRYLIEWAANNSRKPLLLRGARQVGKSSAVRHLGSSFESFVEINLEKQPAYKQFFQQDIDIKRIVPLIAAMAGKDIVPKKTLLFIDEIQSCPEAIMALRFFKEDMPALHVIAAGSLLEFALEELPTFGVGRIHSMFMYPMTFDEFLSANGETLLLQMRNEATPSHPLPEALYQKLISLFRTFILIGGMPEVVSKWVTTHNYLACQELQDDLIITYEDDFPKYRKKVDPMLLRQVMRSSAMQIGNKFVYSKVGNGYSTSEVKKGLEMLSLAGILISVTHSNANGLPLGSEANPQYRKILLLDTGLMLRLLNMNLGDITELTTHILTSNISDLINKGAIAEMLAGLELLHYRTPNIRYELFYWVRQAKNSQAEIDYLSNYKTVILPIEVKAGRQGGMKSLWGFMKEKHLTKAVRCSLENFGSFTYVDNDDHGATRSVTICPLFAISQMERLLNASLSPTS